MRSRQQPGQYLEEGDKGRVEAAKVLGGFGAEVGDPDDGVCFAVRRRVDRSGSGPSRVGSRNSHPAFLCNTRRLFRASHITNNGPLIDRHRHGPMMIHTPVAHSRLNHSPSRARSLHFPLLRFRHMQGINPASLRRKRFGMLPRAPVPCRHGRHAGLKVRWIVLHGARWLVIKQNQMEKVI